MTLNDALLSNDRNVIVQLTNATHPPKKNEHDTVTFTQAQVQALLSYQTTIACF